MSTESQEKAFTERRVTVGGVARSVHERLASNVVLTRRGNGRHRQRDSHLKSFSWDIYEKIKVRLSNMLSRDLKVCIRYFEGRLILIFPGPNIQFRCLWPRHASSEGVGRGLVGSSRVWREKDGWGNPSHGGKGSRGGNDVTV